jgi:hypothetical protein
MEQACTRSCRSRRAAYGTSIEDERVRQHVRESNWEQLVDEQRRLIITGYRHCASKSGAAEERAGKLPFRALMNETIAALVRRQRRNALGADSGESLDAKVDKIYAHVRRQLAELARLTQEKAIKWEEGAP